MTGTVGPLVALRVHTVASDEATFKGFILVCDSIGGYLPYYWSGSLCAGLDVNEAEIAILQRGLDNPRMLIEPIYKLGAGGTRCLVAFSLVLRSDESALP